MCYIVNRETALKFKYVSPSLGSRIELFFSDDKVSEGVQCTWLLNSTSTKKVTQVLSKCSP